MQEQNTELRGETLHFLLPVTQGADGCDDQRRFPQASLLLFQREVGECLDGLSQSHVVGEDAAEAVPAQELQPAQPFLLVGSQCCPEAGGRCQRFDAT